MNFNAEVPLQRYTISCSNMPPNLLNKTTAKHHFSQFGQVTSMYLRPQQLSCTIDYADKASAEDAVEFAGDYGGVDFDVEWAPTKTISASKKVTKIIDPDWVPDPEVQAELEAMGALTPAASRLPRQQAMSIDNPSTSYPVSKSKSIPKRVSARGATKVKQVPKATEESKTITFNSASYEELKAIILAPAFTSEERYRTLDARDKLIRMSSITESDIAKATSTKGVCPDMCPEKERLMREYQHQVSQYELLPGDNRVMDHYVAVKQYSRSSADQEVPLPHELRPVPVLERTMLYLLINIANTCETQSNLGEWYHFLWDRTRGIRKDITQQELCCQGSVKLVEQCARFHIYCSARLIGEDPSIFDQRINTENLTKCLQSLKYMYHDLAIKGEGCPNEAEFRGYIILLNLQNGNFMCEVKQLKSEIQKSKEVRFAIQVFSALDNNNYVQFFKLVRRTTYLNACILLRYFNQVRARALATIVNTYTHRNTMNFPINELTNILAFENFKNCADFMDHYGLNYSDDLSYVVINKQTFCEPDFSFPMSRAVNIIEFKKKCSIAETIYGEPLKEINFRSFIPQNSFDEEGYLTVEAFPFGERENLPPVVKIPREKQEKKAVVKKPELPKTQTQDAVVKPNVFARLSTTTNSFGKTSTDAFVKPDNPFVKSATTTTTSTENPFLKPAVNDNPFLKPAAKKQEVNLFQPPKTDNIFGAVDKSVFKPAAPTNLFKPVQSAPVAFKSVEPKQPLFQTPAIFGGFKPSSEVILPKFPTPAPVNNAIQLKLEEERKRREEEIKRQVEMKRIEARRKEEERKAMEARARAEKEEEERLMKIRLAEEKKKLIQHITSKSEELNNRIVEEIVKDFSFSLLEDELQRHRKITACSEDICRDYVKATTEEMCLELLLEELVIQETLEKIRERITRRRIRKCFHIWKENVEIIKYKRTILEETPVWIPERSVPEEAQELLMPHQNSVLKNMNQYKLGYALQLQPEVAYISRINVFDTIFNELSSRNLDMKTERFVKDVLFWKLSISAPSFGESIGMFKYIDKWLHNVFSETSSPQLFLQKHKLQHYALTLAVSIVQILNEQSTVSSNGLIFYAVSSGSPCLGESVKTRLRAVLKDKLNIPVAIIVIKGDTMPPEDIAEYLELQKLQQLRFVSDYLIKITESNIYEELNLATKGAMKWLACRAQKGGPVLKMEQFDAFVNIALGGELFYRLEQSSRNNYIMRKACTDPNFVINLFNAATARCLDVCFNTDTVHDFPSELKTFLPGAVAYPVGCEYFPDNWRTTIFRGDLKMILNSLKLPPFYLDKNIRNMAQLQNEIRKYVEGVLRGCSSDKVLAKMLFVVCENIDEDVEFQLQVPNLPWLDILGVFIVDFLDVKVRHVLSSYSQCFVVYNHQDLELYTQTPWWFKLDMFKQENTASEESYSYVNDFVDDIEFFKHKKPRLCLDDAKKKEFLDSIAAGFACLENFERKRKKSKLASELNEKLNKLDTSCDEHFLKLKEFQKMYSFKDKTF